MGLTANSTGKGAADKGSAIERQDGDFVVALAGNPNVGKSTVFNALTGMNQHTGNWAGKTVTNAHGRCSHKDKNYILVDLPGTYSLMSHSVEEEVARDFICFSEPDAVIVICDATCLERNLNLVLQTIEITPKTLVCVNLLDEARKKNISINLDQLQLELGVPVVGVTARDGSGLENLMDALNNVIENNPSHFNPVQYSDILENEIQILENQIAPLQIGLSPRWTAVKLIDYNQKLWNNISKFIGEDIRTKENIKISLEASNNAFKVNNLTPEKINDEIISKIINTGETIAESCVTLGKKDYYERDRKIDRILTSRIFGIPIMLAMLGIIFWLTITGANYPSQLLSKSLFALGDKLAEFLNFINVPSWFNDMIVNGIYRVLAWVVSVMLPPMAIFFPLFTLAEDLGYLPRVAFNLDKHFRKANACGKQALTMCMGFGCNAAGVTGCRIIDSPRERLIAIITNNFVPCNGRFPPPF